MPFLSLRFLVRYSIFKWSHLTVFMSISSIKAITFDAGHTLFRPHPSVGAVYREVMLRYGLDYAEEDLEAGFRRAFSCVSKNQEILDGEEKEKYYWRQIVAETLVGLEPAGDRFDAMFEELWLEFGHGHRWQAAEDASETLLSLKKAGYQLAILSNWDKRLRAVVAESGYKSFFEHIFISSEIGFEKPDPRIFQYALDKLGVSPHQLLHVGDSLKHDLIGAQNAGCQAALISNQPSELDNGAISISKLEELIPILSQ